MPTIVYVDDDPPNLDMFRRTFDEQFEVHTAESGPAALDLLQRLPAAVVISDQRMDPMTGIELLAKVEQDWPLSTRMLLTAFSDRELLLAAIQRGRVHDFVLKPWNAEDLGIRIRRAIDEHVRRVELARAVAERDRLREDLEQRSGSSEIVGLESELRDVASMCERIAATDSTVIIRGENGTGKELFARRIHKLSARAKGPFVAVNCAALNADLLDSELFGHEKGSFTTAHGQRIGRFEQAHGGTLFLDEIGDIPPETQVKLLRVLQERNFERVGGNKTIEANFRLITATNQPLEERIKEGRFRQDLFFRLDVSRLKLPPLRKRPGDIERLAKYFVTQFGHELGKVLTLEDDAIDRLRRYDWPGNVRELRNAIERAAVLAASGTAIGVEDLSLDLIALPAPQPAAPPLQEVSLREQIEREEADRIREALRIEKFNVTRTAKRLGIPRTTLTDQMKRYGIS
jgi:DNA-binding NtrC family response regulator